MGIVVWIVSGLALSVLARAVAPEGQAPGIVMNTALGVAGGLFGGLIIDRLAQSSVAGFTAGFIGSIMGSSVLLIVGNVLTVPDDAAT